MTASKHEFDHAASTLSARMVSLDDETRRTAAAEARAMIDGLPPMLSRSPHCAGEIYALETLIMRVGNEGT